MFEIFTLGDLDFLREVIVAVVALMNVDSGIGSGYFVMTGFIIGIMLTAIKGAGTGKYEPQVFMVSLVLWLILFMPRVDIVINSLSTGESATVDDVPLGIAAAGSIVSTVGMKIAEKFEQAFSTPKMSENSGFLKPLRAILTIRDSKAKTSFMKLPSDPAGTFIDYRHSFENYLQDCVIRDIKMNLPDREIIPSQLNTAEDVWANLQVTSSLWDTILYLVEDDADGQAHTCTTAYTALDAVVENDTFQAGFIEAYLKGTPYQEIEVEEALAEVANNTMSAFQFMLSDYLKYHYKVAESNDASGMNASLIEFQAMEARRIQGASQRSLLEEIAQPLATFVEMLFYFLAPFMAFMLTLGQIGLSMIGKYFLLLIWVNTWPLTMSVVNLYTWLAYQKEINDESGGIYPPQSWTGMDMVYTTGATWMSVASMLAGLVPIISMAILAGGAKGVAGAMGRFSSGEKVDAGIAAPKLTEGANKGQVSVGDRGYAVDAGNSSVSGFKQNGFTRVEGAEIASQGSVAQKVSAMVSKTSAVMDRAGSAISQSASNVSSLVNSWGSESETNSSKAKSVRQLNEATNSLAETLQKQNSYGAEEAHSRATTMMAGASLGTPGLAKLVAGASARGGIDTKSSAAVQELDKYLEQYGIQGNEGVRNALAKGLESSFRLSEGLEKGEKLAFQDSVNSAKQNSRAYEAAKEDRSQLQKSLDRVQSNSSMFKADIHDAATRGSSDWYREASRADSSLNYDYTTAKNNLAETQPNWHDMGLSEQNHMAFSKLLGDKVSGGDFNGAADMLRFTGNHNQLANTFDELGENAQYSPSGFDVNSTVRALGGGDSRSAYSGFAEMAGGNITAYTVPGESPILNDNAIKNADNSANGSVQRVDASDLKNRVDTGINTARVEIPGQENIMDKETISVSDLSANANIEMPDVTRAIKSGENAKEATEGGIGKQVGVLNDGVGAIGAGLEALTNLIPNDNEAAEKARVVTEFGSAYVQDKVNKVTSGYDAITGKNSNDNSSTSDTPDIMYKSTPGDPNGDFIGLAGFQGTPESNQRESIQQGSAGDPNGDFAGLAGFEGPPESNQRVPVQPESPGDPNGDFAGLDGFNNQNNDKDSEKE
jgi:conjugal transfer mating pair stabilization protein TraG